MHASFLFYHSNLQLAYTTQAWILEFKTCGMQTNIFKCIHQVYELAPPTCVLKILIDPLLFHISSPMSIYPPLLSFHYLCTIFSPSLSSMTTKVQNVDSLRSSMSINGVRIIFSNLVQTRLVAKDI